MLRGGRMFFRGSPKDQNLSVDPYLVFVADEVRKGRAVPDRESARVEADDLQAKVLCRRTELIKRHFKSHF